MPNFIAPLQVIFHNRAFNGRSIQLKLDGVIVEISSVDLMSFQNENGGVLVGSEMSLRFMPTARLFPLEQSDFEVKLASYYRLSLSKFHVYFIFQSRDKFELTKLKRHIAELTSAP